MKSSKITELQIVSYLRKQEPQYTNVCVTKEVTFRNGKTRSEYRAYTNGHEIIGSYGWSKSFTTTNKLLTYLKKKYEKKN